MHSPIDNFWGYAVGVFVVGALLADLQYDIRRFVRGRSVVLVGILSWFLLEGIKLSPVLITFPQAIYNYSILCVFLSAAAFLFGYHFLRPTKLFDPVPRQFRQLDDPELLWRVVMICALVGFAPIAYYSGMQLFDLLNGILGMRKSWGGLIARGRYGDFRAALLMLEYFINGASPLAVILLLDRRVSALRKMVCLLVAVWPLLRAFGSATRSAIIAAILPIAAVVYFKSPVKTQRAMLIATLLCVPTIYYFMAAMVGSRNSGQFSWQAGQDVTYVGNEMLQELAFIIEKVPEHCDYQYGYSYYVQLVNPIPRFLWPGKPVLDAGILLAQLKGSVDQSGEATYTNSPGLIGEMYLNFGVYGVIVLSAFGGWLVRGWDRLIDLHNDSLCTMIFYSMGLAILYVMGRSFNMSMFYAMLFLYAGIWIVVHIFGYRAAHQYRPVSEVRRPQ